MAHLSTKGHFCLKSARREENLRHKIEDWADIREGEELLVRGCQLTSPHLPLCLLPLPTCRAPKIYLALVISQRPFLFFTIPGHGGKTDCVNLILTFTMLMICQSSHHLWAALALAQLWVSNADLWVGDVDLHNCGWAMLTCTIVGGHLHLQNCG